MELDGRNIEEIDIIEEYEMIPLEPRMYGYEQMNMMPSMDFNQNYGMAMGYMQNVNPDMGMNRNTRMYPCMGMNPNMGMSRSMETSSNIEMNPNISIHSNMDIDPEVGMNPWMETSQVNEDMFMSDINSMGIMYGDISMKDAEDEIEGSRQMDKDVDTEAFKDGFNRPNKFNPKHNDVDSIVRRIERYNPLVFRLLNRCGMPYAEAKAVVRRIVRLTLMYSEE